MANRKRSTTRVRAKAISRELKSPKPGKIVTVGDLRLRIVKGKRAPWSRQALALARKCQHHVAAILDNDTHVDRRLPRLLQDLQRLHSVLLIESIGRSAPAPLEVHRER